MSYNIVAVQVKVLFWAEVGEVLELNPLETGVLASDDQMDTWARNEISEGLLDEIPRLLLKRNLTSGIYSIIGLFSLTGGKDADTPNSMGEYWSEFAPVSEIYITRITGENQVKEFLETALSEEERIILFPEATPSIFDLPGT